MQKIMILDVEGLQNKKPYDIGYIITDRQGNIYKKRAIAISSNAILCNSTIKKVNDILSMSKKLIIDDSDRPFALQQYAHMTNYEFMQMFENDIDMYNIKKIYGYNIDFDKGCLLAIFGENSILNKINFIDLHQMAFMTLFNRKYIDFCIANGFLTDSKKYVSTTAQTVYRYITGDLKFIEQHSGLADCEIELKIYLTIIKRKKKMQYNKKLMIYQALYKKYGYTAIE